MYRVSFQTVKGMQWADVPSRAEAMRIARRERAAGARDVRVAEERPHPPGTDEYTARVTANFEQVWP